MIYLLEDDENIRELVCYSLNVTGNEAEGFAAPSEFWRAVSENLPELVILARRRRASGAFKASQQRYHLRHPGYNAYSQRQ